MFAEIICRLRGHARDKRRVWNDGLSFRATCTRCGTPIIRTSSGWRAFLPKDIDPRRRNHPRAHK